MVDVYENKPEQKTVEFSTSYVNKLLGVEITESDISNILMRYGYNYKEESGAYIVFVPPLRLDLVSREDMAEEIGRIYGYDKEKPQIPTIDYIPKVNEQYEKITQARHSLLNAGYREVMTYAFTDKGDVEVLASASDKKFLRTNLLDGLKKSYELNKLNAPLLGEDEIKIFEIGTVFTKRAEKTHVAFVDKKNSKEVTLEEFVASPESDFSGPRGGSPDHKKSDSGSAPTTYNLQPTTFRMWSQYPFIVRDIAVWVPEEIKPEHLSDIYKEFGTELLQGEPKLVDSFAKDGRISYAFRLIFQSYDRTLTIEEVNTIVSKITEKLSSLGFEVR